MSYFLFQRNMQLQIIINLLDLKSLILLTSHCMTAFALAALDTNNLGNTLQATRSRIPLKGQEAIGMRLQVNGSDKLVSRTANPLQRSSKSRGHRERVAELKIMTKGEGHGCCSLLSLSLSPLSLYINSFSMLTIADT